MNTVSSLDGTTIAYDRSGTGPALILVGGAFQHRAFDPRTARLAELLSSRFTVFHYDRRGRGGSGDTAPYSIEREVEDIDALVGAAGGSAHVFGMSSGAALALDATVRLAVDRLAVYEPPFIVDHTRPAVTADYLPRLRDAVGAGRRGDAVELFFTEAVGLPAEVVASMREAPVWSGFEAVAHTLPYDGAVMDGTLSGGQLPTDRWAAVPVPTLVVDGGASPTAMHNAADALARLLPDVRRLTLAGQEHAVEPEVIAPVLTEFFAG